MSKHFPFDPLLSIFHWQTIRQPPFKVLTQAARLRFSLVHLTGRFPQLIPTPLFFNLLESVTWGFAAVFTLQLVSFGHLYKRSSREKKNLCLIPLSPIIHKLVSIQIKVSNLRHERLLAPCGGSCSSQGGNGNNKNSAL